MIKHLLLISLLFLSSCCREGLETDKFLLTTSDVELIPYILGNSISYTHSNGLEFNIDVSDKNTQMQQTDIEHCGDPYTTFESLHVKLQSSIPALQIEFEKKSNNFDPLMWVYVNGYGFSLDLNQVPDLDTLTLNGTQYSDLYSADAYLVDSLIICPKQLFYNKEFGLLQLIMTNDEKVTIKL